MAEGKKSFLLYCDLIHTVSKMPVEKAGELFIHILKYVNDENPITEDLIVNLTFEPIKQQLKRDLAKWDAKLIQKSDAGVNSAFNKFRKKIIENIETVDLDFELGYCRKKNAESGGNDEYFNKCHTFINDLIQRNLTKSTTVESVATKSTVNVNDNVNVNVTVNDIYLKENSDENLEKILTPKNSGKFSDFNIQDAPPQILQSSLEAWTYATDVELRKKITIDHVKDKWLQFVATNKDSQQWYNSENEIYTHFKRWITKQKFEDGNTKQHNKGGGKVGVSEARTTALQNW